MHGMKNLKICTCCAFWLTVCRPAGQQAVNQKAQHVPIVVQGEHKVLPWLQTFTTRKLCGIQRRHVEVYWCVVKQLLGLSYI